MPLKKITEQPKADTPTDQAIEIRKDAILTVSPLEAKANSVVVTDWDSYAQADAILLSINQARKAPFMTKLAALIKPIKESLDAAHALRREVNQPLDRAEEIIKGKMQTFQIEDQRQKAEAARAETERQRKIQEEADKKQAALDSAKTAKMREKLAADKATLDQKMAEAKAQKAPEPVKMAGSTTRKVKKWRIVSLSQFILSLTTAKSLKPEAEELMCLFGVDSVQMNAKFMLDQPEVGEWMPGVEVYMDIEIAGRRQ